MADITMCLDKRCPSRTLCYRFTAPFERRYQSVADFQRRKGCVRCGSFWDNSSECSCELYGMKHRRNGGCEVFEAITMPKIAAKCRKATVSSKKQPKVCKRKSNH
jgi:hypothetical protein